MTKLQKKYAEAHWTHDPTLIVETKDHTKKLQNRINSARLDAKCRPKSETLLAKLVYLNYLVATLLLKQISTGIVNVLCVILTAVGWVRWRSHDL